MDIDGAEESSRQVYVRFVTKLKEPYKAPSTSLAIPTNVTRRRLSDIVNSILKAGADDWQHVPFDFLIEGKFLRTSLDEFLDAKGISTEKVIDIEYTKIVAPRKEDSSLHNDWVSAVDGSNDGYILTGCYDGLGRIWKGAGSCTYVLEGHTGPITSVCVINPEVDGSLDQVVATASKDRSLRLWKFDAVESAQQKRIGAFKILKGHDAAVQSVAAQPSGDMVCSGAWDCRINLWQANGSDDGGDMVSVKKRKKGLIEEEPLSVGEAVSTLVGHTQCVSSVVWPQRDTIYSASWDHSIRRWDVETGKDSLTMFCGKAINCLDIGGEGSTLVVAGASDPIIRIWDPRNPGNYDPIFQLSGHNSWISSCKWHSKSWFHLVSGSYDGKLMIWDLRSSVPLSVTNSHKDKVLCADWWKDDNVISGGADSKLCMSSGISVEA